MVGQHSIALAGTRKLELRTRTAEDVRLGQERAKLQAPATQHALQAYMQAKLSRSRVMRVTFR